MKNKPAKLIKENNLVEKNSKSNIPNTKWRAFTVLHLIISIVIISFVVFGLIFIQNLNKDTNVKAFIAQITEYDFAVKQFYRKYNALPGDIRSTVAFGLSDTDTDGNDNGIIEDAGGLINQASGEITNFWMHLHRSGFISQKFDGLQNERATLGNTFPRSKIGTDVGITVFGYNGKNYYQLGAIKANAENMNTADVVITTVEAFDIDSKIDDGAPKTGKVMSTGGLVVNGIDKDQKCASDDGKYKTNLKGILCGLRIEIGTTW